MVRSQHNRRNVHSNFSHQKRVNDLTHASKDSSQGLRFLARNFGRFRIGALLNAVHIRKVRRSLPHTRLLDALSPPSDIGTNKFTTSRNNCFGTQLDISLTLLATYVSKWCRRLITRSFYSATGRHQVVSNHDISSCLIDSTARREVRVFENACTSARNR